MNLRTSALLLVVLLTFAALWWATAGDGGESGGDSTAGEPLFGPSPLGLRVEREAGDFVLQRNGGFWSEVSPVWFPLTEEAGADIARAVAGAVVTERFTPGEGGTSLREAALDPPASTLVVVDEDGVTRVGLGESTPGGRSYALVEEAPNPELAGQIVVIPEGLHHFVYARRDGSRFERVLPLPPLDAVVGMSLQGEDERGPVPLVREQGRWLLDDDGAPVRQEVVDSMRQLTEGILVREFVLGAAASSGPGVFGLKSPTAVWTLEEAGGRLTRLTLGRSGGLGDDSVYARIEREEGSTNLASPILRLPPAVKFLTEGRAAAADPRVFSLERAAVRAVTIQPEGLPAVAIAAEPESPASYTPTSDSPPPAVAAEDVIEALLKLEGERRVRPPERLYGSEAGIREEDPSPQPDPGPEPPPRGFVGSLTLEHDLTGRTEVQVVRRRAGWVFRLLTDRDRVQYVLDEPSEDVFEASLLPLFRPAGS